MANLMYNQAQDTLMTRQELSMLETPEALGRFHHPYPFADYVEDVSNALQYNGLTLLNEEFAVTNDGNRFFGLMEVAPRNVESLVDAEDWKVIVGLRGSHDQRIPRGLVIGTQVLVCSNLCFHGNITQVKTKQTTNVVERIPELLNAAVAQIPQMAEYQEEVFAQYKRTQLFDATANDMLVELYQRGAFSSPQLTRAIDEFYKPSHDEHLIDGNRTVWTLFNACTEALKPTGQQTNMHLVESRSLKVSDYLEERLAA